MKTLFIISLLFSSALISSEIPSWYKQDVAEHLENAQGVVVFQVVKVTQLPKQGQYFFYRIDGKTINELKGSAPTGACYEVFTEDEWAAPKKAGDRVIVILNMDYKSECGQIEPGFSAPATNEYLALFKSIIKDNTKH